MKKKLKSSLYILSLIGLLLFVNFASAQLPTIFGMHGKVNISNGNLTVEVSENSDCTLPFYNNTFVNNITNRTFFLTVGINPPINLTYRKDYYLRAFGNNEVISFLNAGTCFRAQMGQGEILMDSVNGSQINNTIGNYINYTEYWIDEVGDSTLDGSLNITGNVTVDHLRYRNGTGESISDIGWNGSCHTWEIDGNVVIGIGC